MSVAGTPMNSPVCFAVIITSAEARSPLATDGPIVAFRSENEERIISMNSLTPSIPSDCPGNGS